MSTEKAPVPSPSPSPAPSGGATLPAHTAGDADCSCGCHGHGVQQVKSAAKVGRNDPCPCGSGRKHKKCCGR
jgi:preprotein translocase subunit SecA